MNFTIALKIVMAIKILGHCIAQWKDDEDEYEW